jgi:hypothetical protein
VTLSTQTSIPAASPELIGKIHSLEAKVREYDQTEFVTEHVFYAGMYARTVRLPANILFTSVLIKRATILITTGTLYVMVDGAWCRLNGHKVVQGEAGRKSVYVTGTDVAMTMIFPTSATTVEEAEAEFTDECENLLSRKQENGIVNACLE